MSRPTGTVTFLFTDVEGSTRLLSELGAERYAELLDDHRRVLREAFARHAGVEVDTQGDAFFVAFARASDAVAAAAEAQASLGDGPIPVRMGLHTGEPTATGEGYVGLTSTAPRVSPRPGTAARCSSRARPATSSLRRCAISATTASRTSRPPSGCSSSARPSSRR